MADITGTICGIDPGRKGAVSWVSADGHLIETDDLPFIEVRGKMKINAALLREMLLTRPVVLVVIEGVMAMPSSGEDGQKTRMGATSAFNFGYGAGLLEGVATGLGFPVQIIAASSWKARANVPRDKGAAREMATRFWPGAAGRFKRIKDDGRAESALLARYVSLARRGRDTPSASVPTLAPKTVNKSPLVGATLIS
jgi:crossover junction endodeoxyribonuclease RuvC